MNVLNHSLAGKVAMVTGGRRGIGKAIALAFDQAGANVAVCDIATEDGQLMSVAEEIQKMGRRSLAVQGDTSKRSDVEKMSGGCNPPRKTRRDVRSCRDRSVSGI